MKELFIWPYSRLKKAVLAVDPREGAALLYARPLGVKSTFPVVAQIHCFSIPCAK